MAAAASSAVFSAAISIPKWRTSKPKSLVDFRLKTKNIRWHSQSLRICASVSALGAELKTGPDDLVGSILSKVTETDRGISLKPEQHKEVAEVATELQKYCVSEPVKSPLIFGDWDVVYCSNPTSPGGGYRSAVGRLFFQTKEMVQALEAPNVVRNKVSFSLLGFLDGQVSLKGKLKALDDEWIQVIFEAPELRIGGLEFSYGGQSEVKLQIVYIDKKIRLGKGSRGSLFVLMRPSYHPEGLFDENKVASSTAPKERANPINQLWHQNGKCPENTIPIRRTKSDDVLRASSVKRYGRKKHRTAPQPRSVNPDLINQSGHQHAIAYVEGDKYYGAKATINVWEPKIQQSNEFSLSQLWILGGSFGQDLNSIEAGWQVSPDLYGDNNTRLFTYWTSDAYQATGCYNLLCSGFIQINNEIAMGASISPVSSYRSAQYDVSILIWKDPNEGNWWMQFGNGYVLGYWPSFLFSYLADSASMIEWGGEVVNSEPDGEHTSTQMGSGRFPEEGFGKASYFRNIQVVDGSNNLRAPKGIGTFTEQSNCYDVQTGDNGDWGHYFYYGGPGKNPNCP